ncbi:MAG TPA: class I SAM-dependent methyltransferase [Mycobacteriales bacterium]|nr:class I SAM-dependent methyltransferase [Mycobacteriales bacterium]
MSEPADLARLYSERFSDEQRRRTAMWQVLCERFFQGWVDPGATVLEVAAGQCEFINNIGAARKIAIDLNPDIKRYAGPDVEAYVCSSTEMRPVADASVDVAFVSNFFEHISKTDILATLREIRRVLRPGGRVLVLQPNIRFCGADYWMFFDHITPLDDRSLEEALVLADFGIEHRIVRFLPYTTKGKLPTGTGLVKLYLRVPLAWRLLGQQSFVVARPTVSGSVASGS